MNLHRRLAPFLLALLAICIPLGTAHADDEVPAKTGTSTAPPVAAATPEAPTAPATPEAPTAPATPASESHVAAATPGERAPGRAVCLRRL